MNTSDLLNTAFLAKNIKQAPRMSESFNGRPEAIEIQFKNDCPYKVKYRISLNRMEADVHCSIEIMDMNEDAGNWKTFDRPDAKEFRPVWAYLIEYIDRAERDARRAEVHELIEGFKAFELPQPEQFRAEMVVDSVSYNPEPFAYPLTENEIDLLFCVAENDFHDGNGIEGPIWKDCILQTQHKTNLLPAQLGALVGHLIKKELLQEANDDCISLTKDGVDAYNRLKN